ncbi:hypothetical protein NE664_04645 [Anaerotignum faecicola]|nr:hypothetical protein [Anaerotignum faecicola]
MAFIGIISVIQFFFALIAATVTGRREWLITLFWCIPTFMMAYTVNDGMVINGLVIVISFYMFFITAYSLWGIKLWHTGERKNKKRVIITLLCINFVVCSYCIYQCITLGYFGKSLEALNKAQRTVVSIIAGAGEGAVMLPVSVTALDRFFSKKENFVLIHCSPLRQGRKNNVQFGGRFAIKGVQNGKEYIFNMTRKAFLLLKKREHFIMEARRGILGGVYVQGDLYKNENRRNKRINRVLIRSGIFVFISAAVVILFIIRIKTGVGFGRMFEELWKEVLNWIK